MLVDIEAPDARRAAGLDHQPGQDVDQGRLAGAIRAQQPEDLPTRHVEADLFERPFAARISLAQRVDADCRGGFGHARLDSGAAGPMKAKMVNAAFTLTPKVILTLTL